MSSTCFISDLHLDAARPHVFDGLAAFLQRIRGCDALYILGDLFETWIGDDDDAPLATATCDLLRSFTADGNRLLLMHGNRDFVLGDRFAAACGATLLADPHTLNLYGVDTLLLHGDSLCTGDAQYQAFRKQARDPAWQAAMLARPLDERRQFAAQLRKLSHEATSNKPEDITDVDPDTVDALALSHGVRRVIHGHTHRPARHDTPFGTRWVLGDWNETGWVLRVDAQGESLEEFQLIQ